MEDGSITFIMTNLVLQIGIIIFVVRAGGYLVKKIGIPPVLGELLAGVVIGPYALGGIPPGFQKDFFLYLAKHSQYLQSCMLFLL